MELPLGHCCFAVSERKAVALDSFCSSSDPGTNLVAVVPAVVVVMVVLACLIIITFLIVIRRKHLKFNSKR